MKAKPMSAKAPKSLPLPPAGARAPSIADLRAAIDRAEADGVDRGDMVLRLTLRDESTIKRSPTVALDEVSFADGQMRFLGVKVVAGAVAVSYLEAQAAVIVPTAP
jgi:hypothetical protein